MRRTVLASAAWGRPAAPTAAESKDATRARAEVPLIVEALAIHPGASVADIGAGCAWVSAANNSTMSK